MGNICIPQDAIWFVEWFHISRAMDYAFKDIMGKIIMIYQVHHLDLKELFSLKKGMLFFVHVHQNS
jgi:hypothetical protein